MTRISLWALVAALAAIVGPASVNAQSTNEGTATDQATSTVQDTTDQATSTAQDTTDQAASTVQDTADQAVSTAQDTADQAASKSQDTTDQAASTAQDTVDQGTPTGQDTVQADAAAQAQLDANVQPVPNDANANVDANANRQGQADINAQAGVNQQQLNQQQINQQQLNQQLGIQFNQAAAQRGLAINSIARNSVFFDSGLLAGDVLLAVAGRPIANQVEFARFISAHPAQRIPVVVMRNGQRHTVFITRPANFVIPNQPINAAPVQLAGAFLGVTFDGRVTNAAQLRLVAPGSPAEHAGLRPGDVILALNSRPVSTGHEAVQLVGTMKPGQQVVIDFSRQQLNNQTQAVLATKPAPVQHSVGYPPAEPAPTIVQPSEPRPTIVQPVVPAPRTVVVPQQPRNIRATLPADAGGDGRFLDGRVPRRFRR